MNHVSILIPHYADLKANFTLDLVGLMACFPEERDLIVQLERSSGSILPELRQGLALKALQNESTHALFLDCDMRFPPDALLQLLKRDRAIVGANYTQRNPPHRPTASKNDKRLSSLGRSGIEEVDTVGFGCCLIETQVIARMETPLFMFGYNKRREEFVGEDVFFFKQARSLGFKTFVDHDLSQEVRHIGEVELDCDMSAVG